MNRGSSRVCQEILLSYFCSHSYLSVLFHNDDRQRDCTIFDPATILNKFKIKNRFQLFWEEGHLIIATVSNWDKFLRRF